ncbi:hypothetical protein SAMN04487944_104121 [Gracilibacillus ureilyticus]|uniref:DUF4870 domain-containing protein n=1 Tax=Gracilibacillus ureilyticus TaxID=531814 RepID=A0A1H9P6G9_9BACI|nr:DUF4870 domain-containing protein [Gracilibacillus ureilyticus]SER43826.1 hypothetical protein SAMN04487944_104121 [Gracilibacillus ureilyticus]
MNQSDERLFSMLIYVLSVFFPVIAPLLIWLLKREESTFVDFHGKEYFNFLISFTIYGIVSTLLMLILIGFALVFVVGIGMFVLTIVGAVKAYNGERYKLPLVIHFLK